MIMSAPDTNIEKQEKQHKPALLGIKGGVLRVALLLFFVVGNGREDEDVATDGAVIEQDAGTATVDAPVDPLGTTTTDGN
jgi:hypothetical protein